MVAKAIGAAQKYICNMHTISPQRIRIQATNLIWPRGATLCQEFSTLFRFRFRFPSRLSSIRLPAAGSGATKVNDNLIMSLTGSPGNQDRVDTKPAG